MTAPRLVAIVFLSAVGLLHAARLVHGIDVVVHGTEIPMWPSGLAVVFTIGLAIALWREGRKP